MFQRRSLMLTRPQKSMIGYALLAAFVGAGGVYFAYDASFGGNVGGSGQWEARLFGWLTDPLPDFVRSLLWLLLAVLAVIALGWESLVNNGKRSNLEYEETAQGFDVFHHDWKPPLRASRRAVPRGANVTFSVPRAGRAGHGVVRKWNAIITANGVEIAKVEVTAAVDSQLDRFSFAPLLDVVRAQGGTLYATDPMAERLLRPPSWFVAQPR